VLDSSGDVPAEKSTESKLEEPIFFVEAKNMKVLTIALLLLIAVPVAQAANLTIKVDTIPKTAVDGKITLGSNLGVVKMTLGVYTILELNSGDPDMNDGVTAWIVPGIFTDTGEKIGNGMTYDNTDHGNTLFIGDGGGRQGDDEDDIAVAGGGVGYALLSLSADGPGTGNPALWVPGTTGGNTLWATFVVRVNTNDLGAKFTATPDPTTPGVVSNNVLFDANALLASIGKSPWLADSADPNDLNGAGHYDVREPKNIFLQGLSINIVPEPAALLLLAPAAMLLRRRR
jgi:hypothetical protein